MNVEYEITWKENGVKQCFIHHSLAELERALKAMDYSTMSDYMKIDIKITDLRTWEDLSTKSALLDAVSIMRREVMDEKRDKDSTLRTIIALQRLLPEGVHKDILPGDDGGVTIKGEFFKVHVKVLTHYLHCTGCDEETKTTYVHHATHVAKIVNNPRTYTCFGCRKVEVSSIDPMSALEEIGESALKLISMIDEYKSGGY